MMDERRVLAEIEEEFRRDEPVLAYRLAHFEWPSPLPPRRLAGIAAAIISVILLGSTFAGDGDGSRCIAAPSYGAWASASGAAERAPTWPVPNESDADAAATEAPTGTAADRSHYSNRLPATWQTDRCTENGRSPLAVAGAGRQPLHYPTLWMTS